MTATRCVFTYGSLMYDAVWEHVVGGRYRRSAAVLDGWRRLRVLDEAYPALVPGAGGRVGGVLYHDVEPQDLQRLDAFEGPEYDRVEVTVQLDDGRRCAAQVYRWIARDRLIPLEWDPEWFEREGMAPFLQRYAGGVRGPQRR
ncbi:MAG TPA: gamma-glutamylcyclotransferase family protein [Burkholderiaceae bacterium]|nr:gamma-glutamylcyclotransferase family protein [Burkholderiaceae bacterium]